MLGTDFFEGSLVRNDKGEVLIKFEKKFSYDSLHFYVFFNHKELFLQMNRQFHLKMNKID